MKKILPILFLLLLATNTSACQPTLSLNESVVLATSTQNSVEVSISMQRDENDRLTLSATFTPQDPSLHLYSKDIPKDGVSGLGRPALLEIPNELAIKVIGELTESISAQPPDSAPEELLVYPCLFSHAQSAVELTNAGSRTETVYVTYMACNQQGCRPPVENKAIEIKLPKY